MLGLDAAVMSTIISTFVASVKSVGTACTLAGVGIYLHQRGFVVGNGKRTLALISQQVTIPLLFFTKILYCDQNWSAEKCPNVTDSLRDVWILLVWPVWVCTAGLMVGYGITLMAKVPTSQRNSLMASVAFGNSTGLPITLLTVIHNTFGNKADSKLGTIDPNLFLSVYLVMYPVLQWGIGGFLLAPPSEDDDKKKDESERDKNEDGTAKTTHTHTRTSLLAHNVVNKKVTMPFKYQCKHRGLENVDESMYMSVTENLNRWGKPMYGTSHESGNISPTTTDSLTDLDDDCQSVNEQNRNKFMANMRTESNASIGMDISDLGLTPTKEKKIRKRTESDGSIGMDISDLGINFIDEKQPLVVDATTDTTTTEASLLLPSAAPTPTMNNKNKETPPPPVANKDEEEPDIEKLLETISMVLKRCFQPPVIAALAGLFFASFSQIRGLLVDITVRQGTAPFQWFFDGLYAVGQAAVPINMIILGCNLSASYMLEQPKVSTSTSTSTGKDKKGKKKKTSSKFFSNQASMYVVIGKMIVMPMVGVLSTFILRKTLYTSHELPSDIAGGLYLVLLIVFLCPTANNVMVMVELSGSGSKEGMARIIAYQYAIAPLVLSGTVTGAVLMASHL
mmetsp:Transcript_34270/g.39410  ORF Transcript_34270/g.39410 Transcript_34270/m.39410 type:complete len:622 (-) Transcript_34270:269-2134(-)